MQVVISSDGFVMSIYQDHETPQTKGELLHVPGALVRYFIPGEADPRPSLPHDVLEQVTGPLISVAEFVARFSNEEQQTIMATMAPLALKVLTAPSGMVDVTDATAQQARAALEAAGWSEERLDAIFAEVG